MLDDLTILFERDLKRLIEEIQSFKDETNLWKTEGDVTNCAGNLALHLIGNLNHFIGAQLGAHDYVRNRPAEFNDKNVPAKTIIADLQQTDKMLQATLSNISIDVLHQKYPIKIFGGISTQKFLLHLYGHLNYHLGQINYLRRLLEA